MNQRMIQKWNGLIKKESGWGNCMRFPVIAIRMGAALSILHLAIYQYL
jgi:hypothetical protein